MPENGEGFYRITNKEIFDILQKLREEVRDLLLQKDKLQDHEQRLRSLEGKGIGLATGAIGTVITGLGVLVWRALS